jgi:creatinine amidohydrolase
MKKKVSFHLPIDVMTRRTAVRLTTIGIAGAVSGVLNTELAHAVPLGTNLEITKGKPNEEKNESINTFKKVKYEEMFPEELETALKEFPVAYVPVGSLEWHGRHMPYGVDSLKVHGILLHTAQKYGGIVVPPTYWGHMGPWKTGNHPGLSTDLVDRLFIEIFKGLVSVGFRVVIGVTGHDIKPQLDSLQKAVDAISSFVISPAGQTIGFAMMEGSLNPEDSDVGMDHAAKWETSIMMALNPELVDMKRIENVRCKIESGMIKGEINMEGCGIGGYDPRIYASKEVGEKAIEKIALKIGEKAQELLSNINWKNPGNNLG